MVFINNQSASYSFNVAISPISDFDITPELRIDKSRVKAQDHGVWPTPTYRDGMVIEFQYSLLADSYTDYVTKRLDMVAKLFGANFTGLVSETTMGTLRIGFTGQSELWNALVTVDAFSGPKTYTEGAYSIFMISFYSFTPYFTGNTTPSNKYRWS